MKLYSPSNNFKLDKILFSSKILGLNIQHIEVPYDHKNKQFISQNPNYTLPTLERKSDEFIFGANSIVLYLFEQKIKTLDSFDQAQIYQWLQFAQKQLQNSIAVHILYQNKITEISEQNVNKSKDNITKALKILDQRLKTRTYFISHSISPIDIVFFCGLRVIKDSFQKQLKNLTSLKRWMLNLQSIWIQLN